MRNRGHDWAVFTVRMKKKAAERLVGFMARDALRYFSSLLRAWLLEQCQA
jgi:hypothetical protein